jgi:xanthine dehydrogenase accessory factor
MIHFIDTITQCIRTNQSISIATIVSQTGSTPRTAGAQMLVMPGSNILGTIGGGKIEAEVIKAASKLFGSGNAQIISFDLSQSGAADDLDIICGGKLSVLIESIDATRDNWRFFQNLSNQYRQKTDCLSITVLARSENELTIAGRYLMRDNASDRERFPYPDTVWEQLTSKPYRQRTAVMASIDEMLFLVQHHHRVEGTVYIFGAGHVARQLARLTKMIDLYTVVLDDREEFANRQRFADADEVIVLPSFETSFEKQLFDTHSYIVIVTRGHSHDKTVLAQALKTDAGYIGMIGSRKKRNFIYQRLLEENFSQEDIDRVHSPIGLKIGAETPEEIAISIVAELIQSRAEKRQALKVEVTPENG